MTIGDEANNRMRTLPRFLTAESAQAGSPTAGAKRPRVSREALLLAAILLAGLALRLWLLAHDTPTLDSDEATVGLMGLHLLRGEWTPFFWGQEYMGSLEAALAAPFIWLLGSTPLALRLAPLLVGLGFVATVYLLGRRLYMSGVGLAAAALLALGPPFFVVLSVRAYGGYVETLLLGNVLLLLALRRGRRAPHRSALVALLFGVLAGLALWTDLLALPFVAGAGALVLWRAVGARHAPLSVGARDVLRHSPLRSTLAALAIGLLLGALPAIVYNVMHGGVTLTTILGLTAIGARSGRHASSVSLAGNVWSELTIALPIIAGTAFAGTQAAGLTAGEYTASAAAHPIAYAVALLLVAAALALLLAAGVSLVRRWLAERRLMAASEAASASNMHVNAIADKPPDRHLKVAGKAALLGIAGCYLVAFALSKQPDIAAAPRYLFPLYAALPLIVHQALVVGTTLARRLSAVAVPARLGGWAHAVRPYAAVLPRVFAALALAALLLWNVAGDLGLTPLQTAARDHGAWIAGSDAGLLRLLAAHHARTVISNDYWEGLRLTYESGERVIAVMVTPEGHPGFNRYPPYVRRGLADPRPAYLELLGTPELALRQAQLDMGDLPGYVLVISGQFGVFLPVEG